MTGAASGIGAAAVDVLTAAGADVVATYHSTPPPKDGAAIWVKCDVRDADTVTDTVQRSVEALGGLDVLVHSAGAWQAGIPGYIEAHDLDFVLDTNLKSVIYTNQAATLP